MTVPDTPDRLTRLARLVRARRGELGLDIDPVVRALSMGKETWKKVERADARARASVYGRMERALGWPAGSIEDYLDGGPEPAADTLDLSGDDAVLIVEGDREALDKLRRLDDRGRSIIMAALDAALKDADEEGI